MIDKALRRLRPTAEFQVSYGDDMTTHHIEWMSPNITQPTSAELAAEVEVLKQEEAVDKVRQSRAAEYPAIGDQLDALWKGGEAAADMLAKVQAVKAKYPKE
jgi:hypothetical protein